MNNGHLVKTNPIKPNFKPQAGGRASVEVKKWVAVLSFSGKILKSHSFHN
jgi:hypothetical protein